MAKKKGVRFIAQTLTKKYKKEFPRYTDALPEARRVLAQLQDDELPVNIKNIRGIIRPPKVKLTGAPQLPNGMIAESEYFMLEDYISFIEGSPKNVYFVSNIFPATVKQPLRAGKKYRYEDLFQPFVNYFNSIQKNTSESSNGRYTPSSDWVFIKTMLPVKRGGKWIAEIKYETNIKGADYGWNPAKPTKLPDEDITVVPQPKAKKAKKAKEAPKATKKQGAPKDDKEFLAQIEREKIASAERIRLAEIKLEEKKAAIDAAKELLKEKIITLAEYKDLIK